MFRTLRRDCRLRLIAIAVGAISVLASVSAQPTDLPAGQPVSFSNVRNTGGVDPHAYGVEISLYKHEGTWSGFISAYTGSVADPPAGKLDALQLAEDSGTIAFSAKLSLGLTMQNGEWVFTRDAFQFSGRIDRDTLSGVFVHRLDADGGRAPSSENVVLRRQPRSPDTPDIPYDVWISVWEMVLKARGPKW